MTTHFRRISHAFDCLRTQMVASSFLYPVHAGFSGASYCILVESSCVVEEHCDCSCAPATSYDGSQQSMPLKLETSKSRKKHRRLKQNSSKAKECRAVSMKRCGTIMTSLLHKTYWNMKDRELIDNAQILVDENSLDSNTSPVFLQNMERTFYPFTRRKSCKKNLRKHGITSSLQRQDSECESLQDAKALFYQRMYFKYQDPGAEKAAMLAKRYPNPHQIVEDVVRPLMEAKGQDLSEPVVTSHLKQIYWKACLPLPWSPCFVATHPEKETAVRNVYLRACEQLEKLALMWHDGESQWQPMTCEKVVTMLDTLSKYMESSLTASKGRGFKIILNQAKDDIHFDKNNSNIAEYNNNGQCANRCPGFHIRGQKKLARNDSISEECKVTPHDMRAARDQSRPNLHLKDSTEEPSVGGPK